MEKPKMTESEIKTSTYLSDMLNFIALELETKVKKHGNTHLQNFLLYSFVPLHNYTEAILCLCKDYRPHPAQSLLRSVFEVCVNINFVINADTDKRMALFARDSFVNRRGVIMELQNFASRYPHLVNKASVLDKENLFSLKEFAEKHIEEINRCNDIKDGEKYPKHLIDRVKLLDKEVSPEEAGMYELNYHIMYRQLSLYTHLNSWGLEVFVKEVEGETIFDLGQSEGVDMIIGQAYLYYYDIAKELYEKEVLTGTMPEKYKQWYEELRAKS